MEVIFSKSDVSDDYDWHINVCKEKNSEMRTYTIVYNVKGYRLLNLNMTTFAGDSHILNKKKDFMEPVSHLMAGTPICPACCASFREAVVDFFINDEVLSPPF